MERESSFINRNDGENISLVDGVSTEAKISQGRPSKKMRIGNSLRRSLRLRNPIVAPLQTDNSELYANSYGTFEPGVSGARRASDSGDDQIMTIEAHRVHQQRSLGERTRLKWSRFKNTAEEKLEFFSVSRAMECYGGGAFSYFKFVVWLGRVNFLTVLLYVGAVLLPYNFIKPDETFGKTITGKTGFPFTFVNRCSNEYESQVDNYTRIRKNNVLDMALDILQGTGVMEQFRLLFIGRFFDKLLYGKVVSVQYNTALAFYLCLWATLFVVLLITIISSGKRALKRISMHTEEATFTFKTLVRWDFMMRDRRRAKVEKRSIVAELKKELEEEKRRFTKENMSRRERRRLTCKRFMVWLMYILLTGGSLTGIYFVINYSAEETANRNKIPDTSAIILFILQYLPSIYILVTNFIIEFYCTIVVVYEQYSANTAISITIKRTVFLRFISLGVLMASMFTQLNNCHRVTVKSSQATDQCVKKDCQSLTCWETYVGQQIYKLAFLDVISFLAICLADLLRKFMCRCFKRDLSTVFDIPKNVIDLIYTQTLCWLGMFFCPLLPVAVFIKIVIVYFFKKMCVVFHIYRQDEKASNAAQTDSYFLDTLLFALIFIVIFPLGIATSLFQPSRGCSPYRLYFASTDDIVQGAYVALDSAITTAFERLGTDTFSIFKIIQSYVVIVPVWIILALVIYYFITLSNARKNLNRHLQLQMVYEMKDQAFQQKRALESLKALKIAQAALAN